MSNTLSSVFTALKAMIIVLAATLILVIVFLMVLPGKSPQYPVRLNELLLEPYTVGWEDGFIGTPEDCPDVGRWHGAPRSVLHFRGRGGSLAESGT